jgi:hypothetical protein
VRALSSFGTINHLLKRHVAEKLFNRAFLVSVVIQVALFLLIAIPMIRTIFTALQGRDLYLNRQIVESIAEEFSRTFQSATLFNREIYENREIGRAHV